MTYITAYIPSLSELKNNLEKNPKLVEYYLKYEGWCGDSDSIDFLEEKVKQFLENKKETK